MKHKKFISLVMAALTILALLNISSVAAKENILTGGDFENTSLTAIGDWKFKTYNVWYSGGEINTDGDNSYASVDGTGIGQNVAISQGKAYKLTAKVKTTGTVKLCIQNGDADWPGDLTNATIASATVTGSDWQDVSVMYDGTTQTSHLFVYLWSDSGTLTCIDDVELVEQDIESPVKNPAFDDGLDGWTVTDTDVMTVQDGVLAVQGSDYEAKISQTVSDIENGTYNLSATVTSNDISCEAYVYGKTNGYTAARTALPQTTDPMRITVPSIVVEDGVCEIGMYVKGSANVTLDNLTLTESEGTRVEFLKGGEISKLTYVEDMGGKFYRADGTEGDALQIMAENGFNLARIRLLDDPGKGHGEPDYYLPANYMTEEDCLRMARRAKDKGMQILFSFAYSDYWVDGEKQYIPHRWNEEIEAKGLSGEAMYQYLEDKTYSYTKDVMEKLIKQGTCPEYVSIGNEIQVGLFFGNQKTKSPFISALYNNADMLARFLNAGAKAVRDTSPSTKIILHSDNGGKLSQRNTFKSALSKVGNNYDVIGVSYYPFYNSTVSIDTVVNEFNSLISTYDKDVIIMETGYNWNETKPGGWEGQLQNSGYYQDIYGETQDGQRAFLSELYAKLKQVSGGRCIGDCYWDPIMIHDDEYKIGWAIRESDDGTDSNVVPNSTIFDFDGKAVEGQKAMKYNTNSTNKLLISGNVSNGGVPVGEKWLKFKVNGKNYGTKTDKFGDYILSVSVPEHSSTINVNICGEEEEKINLTMSNEGFMIENANFDTYSVQEQSGIAIRAHMENNTISYELDYDNAKEQPYSLWVALYDGESLVSVKKGDKGTFEATKNAYTLQAFMWNYGYEPLCQKDGCWVARVSQEQSVN